MTNRATPVIGAAALTVPAGWVVAIGAAAPVATDLLRQMPHTRSLLQELGLDYMWARLARLGAGSYLWEHRDYTDRPPGQSAPHRKGRARD